MVDTVEPDSAGNPSGPMAGTPDTEAIMEAAYIALRAFGGHLNRGQARALLPHWTRHGELTPKQCADVVTRFPSVPKRRQRECEG